MNDQAREALGQVIRTYGPTICNTPRSCEMFIRQACGSYPDESKAHIEALRQGVTDDLGRYKPADRPWDEFAGQLRGRLKAKAGLGEVEGGWAVETWAPCWAGTRTAGRPRPRWWRCRRTRPSRAPSGR